MKPVYFLRGDIVGLLTAHFLHADAVVTPVTSSSIIENCGFFKRVYRCRIGSLYVIEKNMQAAKADAYKTIIGFEANGDVLSGRDAVLANGILLPLPIRDAILPILSNSGLARQRLARHAAQTLYGKQPAAGYFIRCEHIFCESAGGYRPTNPLLQVA